MFKDFLYKRRFVGIGTLSLRSPFYFFTYDFYSLNAAKKSKIIYVANEDSDSAFFRHLYANAPLYYHCKITHCHVLEGSKEIKNEMLHSVNKSVQKM